jgi:ElaB/YqjD/DUF883 family membrane-anchored ribosome-binding protein
MSERTEEPATIAQARAQVEQSRARMSETLDEIEDRLVEKRTELREKLNVGKRVREQVDRSPLGAVAIAAGAGFVFGLLGRRRSRRRRNEEVDRDELREMLRESRENGDDDVHNISIGRAHPSFWQEARAQLVGALTAALVAAVSERFRPHADSPRRSAEPAGDDWDDEEPEARPRRRRSAAEDVV